MVKLSMIIATGMCCASQVHGKTCARPNTIHLDLKYVGPGIYVTYFTAGSPPQSVPVAFDTGTSDSVLPEKFFSAAKSLTCKPLGQDFSIVYGFGAINGTWIKDTIGIQGGASLSDLQFAIGKEYSVLAMKSFGYIGLGLEKFETTYTFEYGINRKFPNTLKTMKPKHTYRNFPSRLKDDGLIAKNLFAVGYPNQASLATLTFGGVDTSKYKTLITVPIIQRSLGDWHGYQEASMMAVTLNDMCIEYGNRSKSVMSKQYPALVDTLTLAMSVPLPVIESLEGLLGGHYDFAQKVLTYDCHENVKLSLRFGNKSIKIPLEQIAQTLEALDAQCVLHIIPSPDDFIILGLSVLSSLYTVFNADDLEISLGLYQDSVTSLIVGLSEKMRVPNAHRILDFSPVFKYEAATYCLNYSKSIFAKD